MESLCALLVAFRIQKNKRIFSTLKRRISDMTSTVVTLEDFDVLNMGDHLITERLDGLYTHHGIYIGNGEVIHHSGKIVETVSLYKFSKGAPFAVRDYKGDERLNESNVIVKRARDKLDETYYSLPYNNCEHFAEWCSINVPISHQGNIFLQTMDILPYPLDSADFHIQGGFQAQIVKSEKLSDTKMKALSLKQPYYRVKGDGNFNKKLSK